MLNQPFDKVEYMPIFLALKREAQIKGWLDKKTDPLYRKLQDLCNFFREAHWLNNMNGEPAAMGRTDFMLPRRESWQQMREVLETELDT